MKRRLISILLACLSAPAIGVSEGLPSNRQAPEKGTVRAKVAEVMSKTLKEGERTVNGVRITTRVPPSAEAVKQIKSVGEDAVPVLADYLSSKDTRERGLAVEFIGLLGGPRIVAPLQKVIRSDVSPTIRLLALEWITQAPWNMAAPVLQEAAKRNTDNQVRRSARTILTTRVK